MSEWLNPIPVDDVFDEGWVDCDACDTRLTDELYSDGCGGSFCRPCLEALVEEWEAEARRYAVENCRITQELPEYDPDQEYRPTPEEYEAGMRDAYTPNAFMAKCRHEHTNYDALIRDLYPMSLFDRIAYQAIRARIAALLIDAKLDVFYEFDEV
ncbi:MAG: hypothetical protein JWO38_6553 [Gemmataceae bacterium]|nr:hypothetical protein [Gemmataceae bacterium]